MGGYAWVTLATNDAYSLGALVLAHSLHRVGTKYELAVLITPGVTQTMREKLSAVFSVVMEVNVLDSKDEANLALLARPELGVTFTKLHCWRLTQYEKCVFLDADTLVVRNCDELFEREELSAAPDVGWPDCFNSGVFVYRPSQQTFASITAFAAAKGSFDGGDQGLLNLYFSDWARKDISKHLPFIYNMCSTATYSYLPAFKQFGDDVRIIHFIGITKPWLQYFDTLTGIVQPPMGSTHLQPLLQLWWNIFCEKVHPQLSPVMATSTLAPIWHKFSPMPYHEPPSPTTPIHTDIRDNTQNDIYLEPPDFSEFSDPWETYCVQNDPVICKPVDNETQQYYSTYSSPPPVVSYEQCSYPESVHRTRYESPPEINRDSHHNKQNYVTVYTSPLHNQIHHVQEQPNRFITQNEEQHTFLHSKNTDASQTQPNHWQQNYSTINSCRTVNNVQNHHFHESQHQNLDYERIPRNSSYDSNRVVFEEKEQQQVGNQYGYQHSPNDSHTLKSVEVKQYQHNETYVDHESSSNYFDSGNYQMCDKQVPQTSYEPENQMPHSNSQAGFEYEEQKILDMKVVHDRSMDNSIASQNDVPNKEDTERDENITVTDERTNTLVSTSPHPDSTPCTDFHNVAQESDPHIGDDLNSSNAGLAGALAQMTLGEPRSAEQIALEEHMRKQSWEQGHIDYMGRDSFDNIWKKICETLALAPPRLPSPPKETEKPEKPTADKTEESTIVPSELTQSIESIDEVDKRTAQTTTSQPEEQYLVKNVPITNVPKLLEGNAQVIETASLVKEREEDIIPQISSDKVSTNEATDGSIYSSPIDQSPTQLQSSTQKEVELCQTSMSQGTLPQHASVSIAPVDVVQSRSSEEQKRVIPSREESEKLVQVDKTAVVAQETGQPEISDEKRTNELSTISEAISPVPIQVAESVLQVEPPKESMPPLETVKKPREVPSCPPEAENKMQVTSPIDGTTIDNKLEELSEVKSIEPLQTALPSEEVHPESVEAVQASAAKDEKADACPKEAEASSIGESSSECEGNKAPPSPKTPVRPTRTKESTSASSTTVPKAAQQEKVIKKTAKKSVEKVEEGESTETTDGDGNGKKVTKKVVKKIVKKPKAKPEEGLDDGAEGSNSKQKKTVKVVKKATKSEKNTESVVDPKDPSSSASTTPVPPKRKTKSTASKTVTKKSDVEE